MVERMVRCQQPLEFPLSSLLTREDLHPLQDSLQKNVVVVVSYKTIQLEVVPKIWKKNETLADNLT
jgi:hypothetical protein